MGVLTERKARTKEGVTLAAARLSGNRNLEIGIENPEADVIFGLGHLGKCALKLVERDIWLILA